MALTPKQKKFVDAYIVLGVGTQAAKIAYPTTTYETQRVIASENLAKPNIQAAIHSALPDDVLGAKHKALLESRVLEHMTFPLGPKDEKQREERNAAYKLDSEQHGKKLKVEDGVSDVEIKEMLKDVNCTVRRIEHGEFARHVYFWAPDNRAVKDALDMAYKIKGAYAPEKHANVNVNIEAQPGDVDLDALITNAEAALKAQKLNG